MPNSIEEIEAALKTVGDASDDAKLSFPRYMDEWLTLAAAIDELAALRTHPEQDAEQLRVALRELLYALSRFGDFAPETRVGTAISAAEALLVEQAKAPCGTCGGTGHELRQYVERVVNAAAALALPVEASHE